MPATRPGKRKRSETLLRLAVTLVVTGLAVLAISRIEYEWQWRRAWPWRTALGLALWTTVWISGLSLIAGTVLGFVFALGRMSRNVIWNQIATIYVEVIRGTPLLVQLIIFYYCIAPQLKIDDAALIAVFSLAVFVGAYVAEIFRAGIESIEKGQWEAARSLGLTHWQCMRFVIVPQMIPRILPPLTGQFISNIKDSSLLSVIAISEVTKVARDAASVEALYFEFFIPLALLYLAITFPLSLLNRRLEDRLRGA